MKYIGKGEYIPPFPARDLTDAEVSEFGEETLLATGLYVVEKIEKNKEPAKPKLERMVNDGSS